METLGEQVERSERPKSKRYRNTTLRGKRGVKQLGAKNRKTARWHQGKDALLNRSFAQKKKERKQTVSPLLQHKPKKTKYW